MENNEEYIEIQGTVVFWESCIGTKSQGIYPFIYESADSCRRIMMPDDNPFENRQLAAYDGKLVNIRCRRGRGEVLLVEKITPVPTGNSETNLSTNKDNE